MRIDSLDDLFETFMKEGDRSSHIENCKDRVVFNKQAQMLYEEAIYILNVSVRFISVTYNYKHDLALTWLNQSFEFLSIRCNSLNEIHYEVKYQGNEWTRCSSEFKRYNTANCLRDWFVTDKHSILKECCEFKKFINELIECLSSEIFGHDVLLKEEQEKTKEII